MLSYFARAKPLAADNPAGSSGLARSMAGAIGAAAGLTTVAPLLIPVAQVALVPGWVASGRRGGNRCPRGRNPARSDQ